jgi:hypothetical protein
MPDTPQAQTVIIELVDGTTWRGVGPATLDGKTMAIRRVVVSEPYELPADCRWGRLATGEDE